MKKKSYQVVFSCFSDPFNYELKDPNPEPVLIFLWFCCF